MNTTAEFGYARIVTVFDTDETAGSFLREDGEGGFASGVYRMAREIERLREAIIRAPCAQYIHIRGIPCGWPCDSELPCWKQIALGSDCQTLEDSQ
jgi:hypothetical protein